MQANLAHIEHSRTTLGSLALVLTGIEFIARKPGLAPCVRNTGQGRGCPIGPATTAKRRTHWPEWSRRAERVRTMLMPMRWAFSEAWRSWIVRGWQPRRVGCAGPMPPQTRGAREKPSPKCARSRSSAEQRSHGLDTKPPGLAHGRPTALTVAKPRSVVPARLDRGRAVFRNFGRTRQPLRRSITALLAEID